MSNQPSLNITGEQLKDLVVAAQKLIEQSSYTGLDIVLAAQVLVGFKGLELTLSNILQSEQEQAEVLAEESAK